MITFDWLEANAYETGAPVGLTLDGHMLAAIWVAGVLFWVLDGEPLTREQARRIVESIG